MGIRRWGYLRCRDIPSLFIRYWRVDRLIPRRAAPPLGPAEGLQPLRLGRKSRSALTKNPSTHCLLPVCELIFQVRLLRLGTMCQIVDLVRAVSGACFRLRRLGPDRQNARLVFSTRLGRRRTLYCSLFRAPVSRSLTPNRGRHPRWRAHR